MEETRSLTRLALPVDDTYLFRVGVAVYGFTSISSFMCEVIAHIDPRYSHTVLQDKDSGQILATFRTSLSMLKSQKRLSTIYQTMQKAADLFELLNIQRNDIVHAYPITNTAGNQILHRRRDSKRKYFEVTNEFLDGFISRLHEVSSGLYQIREAVRGA